MAAFLSASKSRRLLRRRWLLLLLLVLRLLTLTFEILKFFVELLGRLRLIRVCLLLILLTLLRSILIGRHRLTGVLLQLLRLLLWWLFGRGLRRYRLRRRIVFVALGSFVFLFVGVGHHRWTRLNCCIGSAGDSGGRRRSTRPIHEDETVDSVGLLRRTHHDVIESRAGKKRCDYLARFAGSEMDDHAIAGGERAFDGCSGGAANSGEDVS